MHYVHPRPRKQQQHEERQQQSVQQPSYRKNLDLEDDLRDLKDVVFSDEQQKTRQQQQPMQDDHEERFVVNIKTMAAEAAAVARAKDKSQIAQAVATSSRLVHSHATKQQSEHHVDKDNPAHATATWSYFFRWKK